MHYFFRLFNVRRSFFGMFALVFAMAIVLAFILPAKEITELPAWVRFSDVFVYKVDDGEATIIGYMGEETEITFPAMIGGYPVTSVILWDSIDWFTPVGSGVRVEHFFFDRSRIVNVTIPEGVKRIHFALYRDLAHVNIPSSVERIGNFAFMDCMGLTSITIPNSVTSIGRSAFLSCKNLHSVFFEGDAPELDDRVFSYTAETFTVYYREGTTGWTNPWNGYPAKLY